MSTSVSGRQAWFGGARWVRNGGCARLLPVLVALALVFPATARAQVAFQSQATAATFTSSPGTLNNLTVSGSNTMLLVGVSLFRSGSTTSPTVSGIKWGGSSGTALGVVCSITASNSLGNNTARFEIWSLANPASNPTTPTVVITVSGTVTTFAAGAAVFANVASLGACADTENSGNSNSGTTSVNVTVPTGGAAFDTLGVNTISSVTINAPPAAQTSLWNLSSGTSAGAASYAGVVTSMSRSWSQTTSIYAYGAVPLNPSSTSGRKGQVIIGGGAQELKPGQQSPSGDPTRAARVILARAPGG